jgi:glycosyltransferase involved in cell wall biosynthesis
MKIALYYPWIYLKSGVERTILETVKRSKHEYTIFTNHYDKKGTYPEFKNLKVVELKKIPIRRNLFSVFQAAIVIIFQKINLKSFDLFLVHSEGLGDLILFRNHEIPAICYCHTPLRPVFDSEYKTRARAKRSSAGKIAYHLLDYFFQIADRYLWTKYRYIFFNSRESLRRAKEGNLLAGDSKYIILHPGIDWEKVKPTWEFKKYFLVPGRIMWTKNIELAINTFNRFQKITKGGMDFRLIIAGQVDFKSRGYLGSLKILAGRNEKVEFVVNPSEERMKKLYADCFLALCTSFNEDWGIVAIEANSFGKPVIAVNKGGYSESQIDGMTGYLLKSDPITFAEKIRLLANNRRLTKKMGSFARKNSKQYDWSYFTDSLDSAISRF